MKTVQDLHHVSKLGVPIISVISKADKEEIITTPINLEPIISVISKADKGRNHHNPNQP